MNQPSYDETVAGPPPISKGLIPLIIVLVTMGVFARALHNDFLVWDDLQYLVQNPDYRGLGWSNITWAFSFSSARWGHYMPLVWLSWGVDYCLWDMRAQGYIMLNILIHAANAVVVYLLSFRLLRLAAGPGDGAGPGDRRYRGLVWWSTLAALLFAVHPLRVESVVWVTERKDVLSGLFYLLTIHTYIRGRGRRLVGPLLLFLLAVLSKSMVVSLPLVLVVLDVYPLRRLGGGNGWIGPAARRVWLAKVPFLILAVAAAVLAPLATRLASADWQTETYDLATRFGSVTFSLWFYVYKTILPVGLSPLYERPAELDPWAGRCLIAAVFTVVATLLVLVFRRRFPGGLAVWVCYGVILAPVAGLVPVGPQIVADRYSYLSCLGFAMLLAGWGLRASSALNRRALLGACIVVLAALAGSTWRQIGFWHDSVSLWQRALRMDPDCCRCHLNLGATFLDEGDLETARVHLEAAIRLDPNRSRAQYNWGLLLDRVGEPARAVEAFRRTLELEPDFLAASGELARILATCPNRSVRDGAEAVHWARRVCEETGYADPKALHILAAAYLEAGQRELAIETARQAFQLAVQQGQHELADRIDRNLRRLRLTQPGGDRP